MPRFPYMNFPFPFYKTPSRVPPYYSPQPQPQPQPQEPRDFKQKNKSNKNDNYLFDLFGLKIYYDDVLLVSLIYFLYSEGVKDDGLFIVLILLLLS